MLLENLSWPEVKQAKPGNMIVILPLGSFEQHGPHRKTDMQYGRPVYFVSEFHEVSKTGTIGHPDLASAAKGEQFLAGIVAEVTAFVDAFAKWGKRSRKGGS